MASTNKTANLSLNQWVKSDPVLMEDMNEDNRKLDAALGGMSRMKLFDIVLETSVPMVEFNFSQIDLSKFLELEFYIEIKGTSANYKGLKINNSSANGKYICPPNELGHFPLSDGKASFSILGTKIRNLQSENYVSYADAGSTINSINLVSTYSGANYYYGVGSRIIVYGVRV